MTSSLSFHCIYDAIDNDLNPLRVAIASLRPRVINIVGGARKTQAFSFAVELKSKYPSMRVIFRNYPDDGLHVTDKYKLKWHRDTFGNLIVDDYSGCQRWLDDNQNYLLAKLTVLTDNESVNDQMDVYAAWQAKIMDLAGAKGWSVAVGRFAVGNPRESDYARMRVMWQTLAKWHPLHTWSPNEYLPQNIENASGMINRYQQGIDAAKAIGAWPFDISIGEYGVVYRKPDGGLDANAGYHDSRIGWSGSKAFQYLYEQWETWYKPNGVDACIYCWGGDGTPKWDRFRIDTDDAFIKALLEANNRGDLTPMTTVPPKPVVNVPAPAYLGIPKTITVSGGSNWNLRTEPDVVKGQIVGVVRVGEVINLYSSTIHPNGGHSFYYVERATPTAGESVSGWLAYVLPVTGDLPKPLPAPPPVVVPAPFLEVSAELCNQMIVAYTAQAAAKQKLATSYTLGAQDDLSMAQTWKAVLEQVSPTSKAA